MDQNKEKIRHILQPLRWRWQRIETTWKSSRCLKVVSKSATHKWFARCRSGNFDVQDMPGFGRPITDKLSKPGILTVMIVTELKIEKSNHLQEAGSKRNSMFGCIMNWVWKARGTDLTSAIRHWSTRNEPFLTRIITADEKWINYENIVRRRSWKRDINERNFKLQIQNWLRVWWGWNGIVLCVTTTTR